MRHCEGRWTTHSKNKSTGLRIDSSAGIGANLRGDEDRAGRGLGGPGPEVCGPNWWICTNLCIWLHGEHQFLWSAIIGPLTTAHTVDGGKSCTNLKPWLKPLFGIHGKPLFVLYRGNHHGFVSRWCETCIRCLDQRSHVPDLRLVRPRWSELSPDGTDAQTVAAKNPNCAK